MTGLRRLVWLVIALVVCGCGPRMQGGAGSPAIVAEEAPAACDFPAGAELEYAGRSTTAQLGVQQIETDPLSTRPADIYITRETFDRGEEHGRLVCMILVEQPDFVEVTIHPADDPYVEPTPPPLGSRPEHGIGRRAAVDLALERVRQREGEAGEWDVAVAEAGSVSRLVLDWEVHEWSRDLPADHWVWRVFLVRDDAGVDVFIDYVAGSVLGELEYIVD
jgi:hypothetical protein